MFTACSQHVHSIFTAHSQHIHTTFTPHSHPIHSTIHTPFTPCLHHTPLSWTPMMELGKGCCLVSIPRVRRPWRHPTRHGETAPRVYSPHSVAPRVWRDKLLTPTYSHILLTEISRDRSEIGCSPATRHTLLRLRLALHVTCKSRE